MASFGRGQRRLVGVDRVRDPLSYFFVASGSDRGSQLDVVGYLLSRFRWPPLHLHCEFGCPRHHGNLVLSSAPPQGELHCHGAIGNMNLPSRAFSSWSELMEHCWGDGSKIQIAVEKPSGEGRDSLRSATQPPTEASSRRGESLSR